MTTLLSLMTILREDFGEQNNNCGAINSDNKSFKVDPI
jgi:hypothetical protein